MTPMEMYRNTRDVEKYDEMNPVGPRTHARTDMPNKPILSINAPPKAPAI